MELELFKAMRTARQMKRPLAAEESDQDSVSTIDHELARAVDIQMIREQDVTAIEDNGLLLVSARSRRT